MLVTSWWKTFPTHRQKQTWTGKHTAQHCLNFATYRVIQESFEFLYRVLIPCFTFSIMTFFSLCFFSLRTLWGLFSTIPFVCFCSLLWVSKCLLWAFYSHTVYTDNMCISNENLFYIQCTCKVLKWILSVNDKNVIYKRKITYSYILKINV